MALRGAAGVLCGLGLLAAAPAFAGAFSGTVRGPGGAPLQGIAVVAHSASVGNPVGQAITDADGEYLITIVPGTYFAQAHQPVPNTAGYVGETYAEIPSNDLCGARGTEILVGAGVTPGIDFTFEVGKTITGTATRLEDGLPNLSAVSAYDARGCLMGTDSVGFDDAGAFAITGLPRGLYYLVAIAGGNHVDQLYPGLPCFHHQCDVFAGTPVATGSTADFAHPAGVSISGAIEGPGGFPATGAIVEAWRGTQKLATVGTSNGSYLIQGLPAANGYRVLARKAGFVTEVYPDAPCPAGGCNIGGAGTAIDLPTPGTTAFDRDVHLHPGHSISGSLLPTAWLMRVQVFGSTGFAGEHIAGGTYTVGDLPDGDYVVRVTTGSGVTELYDNRQCPATLVCLGDPVEINGNDRTGINFTIGQARKIKGTVRGATGDPVGGVGVEVYTADGTLMSEGSTFVDGTYETTSEGLPPGTYYVRTRLPRRIHQYLDELFENRPCGPGCVPGTGKPVQVTAAADTLGVDFTLPFAGLDFFTVAPCRIFDSRAGSTIASGVLVALQLEGHCGIPGDAFAVSANVTVTSASAPGHVKLWPVNASETTTSTINFAAGVSRGNNAILPLSLEGVYNVAFRGFLPGGRYHFVIDVNGYFARPAPP